MSLGVAEMCHVLQRCGMCYRDVPGVIDNVLQGCNPVAWCYRDVPGVTYMCLVLHRCASYCIYVLSVTEMCHVCMLPGVAQMSHINA